MPKVGYEHAHSPAHSVLQIINLGVTVQILQHPSDTAGEFAIPVNYRQRFKTTALHCECPEHKALPTAQCPHMIAAHFSELTHKHVLAKILRNTPSIHPEMAIKTKLRCFETLLEQKEVMISCADSAYLQRRRASVQAAWLLWQIKSLRRRVAFIERIKDP